jgi:protein gp37
MSKIEWTEQTWNPTTGCNKISAGCNNCYAEIMARRLQAMGTPGYENGFEFTLMPERLTQPLSKKKPTKYFVNSMSDLFHEKMPKEYLDEIFDVIKATPQHTYQILTKREENMAAYFGGKKLPDNVWMGVTVENIKSLKRIDYLRKVKANIRFLSVEPLLEDLGKLNLKNIHWVIVGGESGHKARPMKKEWAINIKDQCEKQGATFFFKQWGTWGADGVKRSKKSNGMEIDGQVYQNYPEQIKEYFQIAHT